LVQRVPLVRRIIMPLVRSAKTINMRCRTMPLVRHNTAASVVNNNSKTDSSAIQNHTANNNAASVAHNIYKNPTSYVGGTTHEPEHENVHFTSGAPSSSFSPPYGQQTGGSANLLCAVDSITYGNPPHTIDHSSHDIVFTCNAASAAIIQYEPDTASAADTPPTGPKLGESANLRLDYNAFINGNPPHPCSQERVIYHSAIFNHNAHNIVDAYNAASAANIPHERVRNKSSVHCR
jgi:hypothetical protein